MKQPNHFWWHFSYAIAHCWLDIKKDGSMGPTLYSNCASQKQTKGTPNENVKNRCEFITSPVLSIVIIFVAYLPYPEFLFESCQNPLEVHSSSDLCDYDRKVRDIQDCHPTFVNENAQKKDCDAHDINI
jgi:hypothetical protein